MKLGTLEHEGQRKVVVLTPEGLLLPLAAEKLSLSENFSMEDLIEKGDELLEKVERLLADSKGGQSTLIHQEQANWLPPLTHPGKICGIAMNNSASNSRKISAPEHPAFFLKPASCLIGHNQPIQIRSYYGSVHPEPELAVIIGKKARDIGPDEALDHVFGYSIFNDITGNGMRGEDLFQYYALYPDKSNPDELVRVEQHLSYAARYKGTDCFGVLGPWIVTRDEISDPDNLSVRCSVAGEKVAEDNTAYYNYKVAEVLSFISNFQTLNPGDIVSMGTAFKPGATRKSIHQANFQNVGGPVEIEIEGLGQQNNPVVVEDRKIGRWQLNQ
jgi:2-keto-4-pentenoate hydratase/2-oxohepta-3-ene-1,7-dioic acid hydratase in catechol pathway